MADNNFEIRVRRKSSRLNKSDKTQANVPPPPPPPKTLDTPPADPLPTPLPPPANPLPTPPPLSEDSQPADSPHNKPVRGRAKPNRPTTSGPTRHSSRLNKPQSSEDSQPADPPPNPLSNVPPPPPPPKTLETPATVPAPNPLPLAQKTSKSDPPKQPQPADPLPTPSPDAHSLTNPPSEAQPADPPHNKPVRGRAKPNRPTTSGPTRHSSRLNKPQSSEDSQPADPPPNPLSNVPPPPPPPKTLETPATVPAPNPLPLAQKTSKSDPPKQPQPADPLPTPLPDAHALTDPPSEAQPADPSHNKAVTGRAKRNRSTTCSPTRHSSRLNKPQSSEAAQGTPEQARSNKRSKTPQCKSATPNPTPSIMTVPPNSAKQQPDMTERGRCSSTSDSSSKETTNSVPNSPLQPEAGNTEWDEWPESDATSGYSEEDSTHPAVVDDDGGIRGAKRIALRDCEEAMQMTGMELEEADLTGAEGQTKRRRKKGQKSDVRQGRGMAKARKPLNYAGRPKLFVVGDAEFTSTPICTKVVATIRVLTLENMPGPYRTYNMFPVKARLEILQQFLQRYTWGAGQNVKRCLQVYETIAADAYSHQLVVLRAKYAKKYTEDKLLWRDFPPQWCKNPQHWKGLCLIWSKEKWDKMSSTNRNNKTKYGSVIHHLGGSKSLYRHKQEMVSKKGSPVTLKEVFDRIHTKETHAGKVYVNKKAEEKMAAFEELKENYTAELSDEDLWDMAVNGEDAKGRLFGFGHRSRTCKGNQALAKEDATLSDHAKSTATSAENEGTQFTKGQVAVMIKAHVAAERRRLLADIAAQEARHNADREEFKKKEEENKKLFAELFKRTGAPIPTSLEGPSKENDGGGDNPPAAT